MKYPDYANIKTVPVIGFDQTEHAGFAIIDILDAEQPHSAHSYNSQVGYIGQPVVMQPHSSSVACKAPLFVLGQHVDYVAKQYDDELASLREAQADLVTAKGTIETQEYALAAARRQIDTERAAAATAIKQRIAAQQRTEQLVNDMQALTKAFGELAVSKALGDRT